MSVVIGLQAKQVDITNIIPCIIIIYNTILATVLNRNVPQPSQVRKTRNLRKAIVENISKELEYVTKGRIATYSILF